MSSETPTPSDRRIAAGIPERVATWPRAAATLPLFRGGAAGRPRSLSSDTPKHMLGFTRSKDSLNMSASSGLVAWLSEPPTAKSVEHEWMCPLWRAAYEGRKVGDHSRSAAVPSSPAVCEVLLPASPSMLLLVWLQLGFLARRCSVSSIGRRSLLPFGRP